MTQGRQSRRGKTALGLSAALLCAVALVPGVAVAAPGENEYGLDIPSGSGGGEDPAANASGGSGGSTDTAPADRATTPTPASETTESTDSSDGGAGGAAGGGDKGGGGDKARSGEGGNRNADTLASIDEPIATTQASDSDDGGFPVILIVIAVLAAAGAGFAAWRLRRGDGVGRPAQPGHSA